MNFIHIRQKLDRVAWAGVSFLFALLAIFSPLWPGSNLEHYLGELLVWIGILELRDSFLRADASARKSTQLSGALSLLMAALLINAVLFQGKALYLFVIVVFGIDAVRYFFNYAAKRRAHQFFWIDLVSGVCNLILVAALFLLEDGGRAWALSLVISLRMVGIGINLLTVKTGQLTQVDTDFLASVGLTADPYVTSVAERVKREEEQSAVHDKGWITIFIFLLFFIHLGRMGLDRTFLGILSPVVATVGDMVIAVAITFAIIAPVRSLMLKVLRKRGQRLWKWIALVDENKRPIIGLRNLASIWLTTRMRSEIRFKKAAYSLPTALRTGLKFGLPWSALLAAIMPVLGMSWYFDTENWASGIWDKWAATRADQWRMAITRSVGEDFGRNAFTLTPDGVNSNEDFSFVIVGDPGEGDASQLILKDQILSVTNNPEVKFLVISSDVVYPTGALKDYEKKFWMPFKGVTKPVYAIPGNHDWYDALDGFIATFYDSASAKRAMSARVSEDLHITATTEGEIDKMISKSAVWRMEYGVPTGFQKAPYFQVHTDQFVLLTLETGVERQIDSLQRKWLKNVLESSKGKFVMVLLGHPFYAIGEYQGVLNPDFNSIHDLLRTYRVPLVMAGDTHDLEYYNEPPTNPSTSTMHHFVNGGGGAYLSIGAAMAAPGSIPTKDYAFYPSHEPLVKKIAENTSWYKYPAWWWTNQLNGWPFSAEWLSAMFDYNVAPYFQSFMEIKVQPSRGQIVLVPYSNHGRIRWSDMTSTEGSRPVGAKMEDFAEWVIPMKSEK